MKKICLVFVCGALLGVAQPVLGQVELRGGAGMIFDGTQPGIHGSLILPFSSKPAGLLASVDYYKKSGVTTVPVTARGLYNINVGESTKAYFGVGSGVIYISTGTGFLQDSSTKAIMSGVFGIKGKAEGAFGFFGQVSVERALTSGASTELAAQAGVYVTFIEDE
ncbi:MAG: hypothetical protein CME19_24185 [Gemmatimonadetes bacterium]|nr:hypothetical protein [Gemmatimonadota bacterium]